MKILCLPKDGSGAEIMVLCFCLFFPQSVWPEMIFKDGFESADFLASQNGFHWTDKNKISIVRDDGYVVNNGEPKILGPFPERDWENAPGVPGQHAMRFRFPSVDEATSPMAEQRFAIGGAYQEIWFRFYLKVPINYEHGNPSGSSSNNKLFALWMKDYAVSDGDPTVIVGIIREPSSNSSYVTLGGRDSGGHAGDVVASELFIVTPKDQGRWMELVFQVAGNSATGIQDGMVKLWRRWADEEAFGLLVERKANYEPLSGGPQGWTAGYVLGWANSGYEESTEFLIDEFLVSKSSLLEIDMNDRPKSPIAISVE